MAKKRLIEDLETLVVPIQLDAVCSGVTTPTRVQPPSAEFEHMPYKDANGTVHNAAQPYLGEFAVNSPKAAPRVLAPGVHLHWSLPDALTRGESISSPPGETSEEGVEFPAVPNRWLVVRMLTDNSDPTKPMVSLQPWIVESDYLTEVTPEVLADSQVYTQIPVSPNQTTYTSPYVLMGRKVDYATWEPTTFTAINKLTAMGYGTEDFAAYYQNCMTVFGLYDDAADLTSVGSHGVLTYFVMGWFADASDDPAIGKTSEQLQDQLSWQLPNGTTATGFSSSVYTGVIGGVQWGSDVDYNRDNTLTDVRVSVGHSPSEALSVLIEQLSQESEGEDGTPDVQTLLNALQQGALAKLIQGDLDAPIKILRSLHEAMFDAYPGGSQYTIRDSIDMSLDSTTRYTPVSETTVPSQFASALNALNVAQETRDKYQGILNSSKWQCYGDWCKYVYAEHIGLPEGLKSTSSQIFNYLQNVEVPAINQSIDKLNTYNTDVSTDAQNLTAQLKSDYELIKTPAPNYWCPNDPVIMLSSADMTPTFRYGFDSLLSKDGYLLCRLDSQITTAWTAPAGIVSGSNTVTLDNTVANVPVLPENSHFTLYDVANTLLFEGFLLNSGLASYLQTVLAQVDVANNPATMDGNFWQIIATAQSDYLSRTETPKLNFSSNAVAPEPTSIRSCSNGQNPWMPLKVHWWMNYYPLFSADGVTPYDPNCVVDSFNFQNPDDVFQLALDKAPAKLQQMQSYWGSSILTPDANLNLQQQLAKFLQLHASFSERAELETVLQDILQWNILSQSLNGLRQQMLMQMPTLQLEIADPAGSTDVQALAKTLDALVSDVAATNSCSYAGFDPLRTGVMQIKSLRVVDVFGQYVDISNQTQPHMTTYVANSMALPTAIPDALKPDSSFFLTPRILQGARVLFRWLGAETGDVQMNLNPAESPICGWVVPNFIDKALMFYDQDSAMLGVMYADTGGIHWQSTPGDDSTISDDFSTFIQSANINAQMKAFMQNIINQGETYLQSLVATLEENEYTIEPEHYKENADNALLLGRPLALSLSQIQLELNGNASAIQDWQSLDSAVQDGSTATRYAAGIEKIQFPTRLGDTDTLNDGLVGFYLASDSDVDYSVFYNLVNTVGSTIQKATDTTVTLTADSSAPAQQMLILFDPRAPVHLTTGILPVSQLSVPPGLYMSVLRQLEFVFLTAPIFKSTVTTQDASGGTVQSLIEPEIPLPAVAEDYTWQWVEYAQGAWTVTEDLTDRDRQDIVSGQSRSLTEGWLKYGLKKQDS